MRVLRGGPALALVLLLTSLGAVVWRQSRALEASTGLAAAQLERESAEAEIGSLLERIQELESRRRVLQVAKERMGMRVPRADEIVILPVSEVGATPGCRRGAVECPR